VWIAIKNILEQCSYFIVLLVRLRELRLKNPCSNEIARLLGEILKVTSRFFFVTCLQLEFGISQSLPRSNGTEVCRGFKFLPYSEIDQGKLVAIVQILGSELARLQQVRPRSQGYTFVRPHCPATSVGNGIIWINLQDF